MRSAIIAAAASVAALAAACVNADELDTADQDTSIDPDVMALPIGDEPVEADGPPTCQQVETPNMLPSMPSAPAAATWDAGWICVGGCGQQARPPLTTTTKLEIGAGRLRWRSGTTVVADHATSVVNNCHRAAAGGDGEGCRTSYDVCSVPGGASVFVVAWHQPGVLPPRWQVWEARLDR